MNDNLIKFLKLTGDWTSTFEGNIKHKDNVEISKGKFNFIDSNDIDIFNEYYTKESHDALNRKYAKFYFNEKFP